MKNINEELYTIIGKPVIRVDAVNKVTGNAKYIPDIKFHNMLYGSILRSNIPHGRIIRIDKSKAEKLPGVKAVITGEDINNNFFAFQIKVANKTVLAKDKVRYVGEEIAAVAAISEEIAKRACSLIKIDIEPLPAIFDVESATQANAPLIHMESHNNIGGEIHKAFGNIEAAFAESKCIVEGIYKTQAIPHVCMETRGAIAYFDVSGNLTLWSDTQFPHILKIWLSKVLDLPERKIRVLKAEALGGGWGSRQSTDSIDPICVYLAKITKQPVKIIKDRCEEFTTDRFRYPMIIKLKTGVDGKGKLLARKVEILTDAGAYHDQAIAVTTSAADKSIGLYRVPNVKIDGKIIFTNKLFGGAFRGYGNPQMNFALESQMDEIAEKLQLDPLELRLLNANRPGDITASGEKFISCGFEECFKKASLSSRWYDKRKKISNNRKSYGIGIAGAHQTGGGGLGAHGGNFSSAFIKVENDGSVDIFTGVPDVGQGSDTVLSQIAAEVIGVKMENVRIHSADTDITPCTQGVRGTRETFVAGNAVKLTAMKVKDEIFKRARILMNIKEHEVLKSANNKIFLESNPNRFIMIKEVAGMPMYNSASAFPVGIPIVAAGCYKDEVSIPVDKSGYGNPHPAFAFGVQIVELEVDKETGEVIINKITAAYDLGQAINSMTVVQQMESGICHGLGMALSEEFIWENGVIINGNLTEYKVPSIIDFPKELNIIWVETNDPNGPFGAKGIGEIVMVPTSAAVANAIYNAIGIRFNELPITREKILNALQNGK